MPLGGKRTVAGSGGFRRSEEWVRRQEGPHSPPTPDRWLPPCHSDSDSDTLDTPHPTLHSSLASTAETINSLLAKLNDISLSKSLGFLTGFDADERALPPSHPPPVRSKLAQPPSRAPATSHSRISVYGALPLHPANPPYRDAAVHAEAPRGRALLRNISNTQTSASNRNPSRASSKPADRTTLPLPGAHPQKHAQTQRPRSATRPPVPRPRDSADARQQRPASMVISASTNVSDEIVRSGFTHGPTKHSQTKADAPGVEIVRSLVPRPITVDISLIPRSITAERGFSRLPDPLTVTAPVPVIPHLPTPPNSADVERTRTIPESCLPSPAHFPDLETHTRDDRHLPPLPKLLSPPERASNAVRSRATSPERRGDHPSWLEDDPDAPSMRELDREENGDPTKLREYAEDIWKYLERLELHDPPSATYFSRQPNITPRMRTVLLDWLADLHHHFGLCPETLLCASELLDRFLTRTEIAVAAERFQLLGVACFLVAAKYEEVDPPTASSLVMACDGAYTHAQLVSAELHVLSTVRFAVSCSQPLEHLRRASRADGYDPLTRTVGKYFLEVVSVAGSCVGARGSTVAAACAWVARKAVGKREWTPAILAHTAPHPHDPVLVACARAVLDHLRGDHPSPTLRRKYASSGYMCVSLDAEQWAKGVGRDWVPEVDVIPAQVGVLLAQRRSGVWEGEKEEVAKKARRRTSGKP